MKKLLLLIFSILILVPIPVFGANTVEQIIKLKGNIEDGIEDKDFILPSSVTNQNKTIIFMSVRHVADGEAKNIYKSWDFVNNTAIRFHGSSSTPATNLGLDFVAYLVEFTASSTMIVQNGTLTVDGADVDQEFLTTLSPSVNTTNSFFTFDGLTMDHSDVSWGSEEFGIMRIVNDTTWGYEPFDAPNSGDTEVRFSVIDWNDVEFVIQNGTGTLLDGVPLDTIIPSPAVDRDHTIVLVTSQIEDELDATSDEHGVTATLNASNEIEIEREDDTCPVTNCEVNYRWELITFPTTFANVTHGVIADSSSTSADVAESIIHILSESVDFDNSIVTGTVQTPLGLGNARDSSGSAGSWDRLAYTLELINSTAINATINDGQETPNLTFQIIEFLPPIQFNQTVIDTTTNLDETNFNITKSASDVTVTVDTGQSFNITKGITDTVSNIENVNISTEFGTSISDNTTNTDEIDVFVVLKPVPAGSSGAPSSGLPTPSIGTPMSPVRLIGLNVGSETLIVEASDVVPSDFQISWFGDDFEGIELTKISATQEFIGFNQWFSFSPTPDQLNVSIEEKFENRLPTDPKSLFNTALDDFVLNVPSNACTGDLVGVATSNCFNPIIYEVPLEFEFMIKGATFSTEHIVVIDGRDRPKCVILGFALPQSVCDFVDFLLENWWWIILAFLLLFIIPKAFKKRRLKVAHFIPRRGNDKELGNTDTEKRLKRLKKTR